MGFKRSNISKIQNQLDNMTSSNNYEDKDEWKLATDSAGNGNAIIRFLPSKDDDSLPFVKIYTHGFNHKGQWFVENCPTTLNKDGETLKCPVCESNSELWNTELEANKDIARDRKRNLSYWSNIMVIKDSKNPENEGKVFKYRFGSKIMEKIQKAANPPEELGDDPVDVTCVFDGADFFLSTKKVSGYQNYDDSQFKSPKPIKNIDDEEYQDELMKQMHDLNKIVAPDQFKSYNDLKKRLDRVIGETKSASKATADAEKELDDFDTELNSAKNEGSVDDDVFDDDVSDSVDSSADVDDDDLDDLLDGLDED
ncbi:MAG: hypothetical protein CL489_08780 [Acidobacteria bacterium]|nr:hypothetical protein [Acidobacteriota bacterium]|tara:strand:- start:10241 stop:11173 length:933 start_codon:yes stop_codon:yes gene_type:complete